MQEAPRPYPEARGPGSEHKLKEVGKLGGKSGNAKGGNIGRADGTIDEGSQGGGGAEVGETGSGIDEGGAGGGGSTHVIQPGSLKSPDGYGDNPADISAGRTFGSDADFGLLVLAIVTVAVATHLFNFSSRMYSWLFAEDKHAPPRDSGINACGLAAIFIAAICLIRTMHSAQTGNLLTALIYYPRNITLGLFAFSIVPSAIALSKTIGLLGAARFPQNEESRVGAVGLIIGTGLLSLTNLIGSLCSIWSVVWPLLGKSQ